MPRGDIYRDIAALDLPDQLALGAALYLLFMLLLRIERNRVARAQEQTEEWYRQAYPTCSSAETLSCCCCYRSRIVRSPWKHDDSLNAHVCANCGETLFYSPTPLRSHRHSISMWDAAVSVTPGLSSIARGFAQRTKLLGRLTSCLALITIAGWLVMTYASTG